MGSASKGCRFPSVDGRGARCVLGGDLPVGFGNDILLPAQSGAWGFHKPEQRLNVARQRIGILLHFDKLSSETSNHLETQHILAERSRHCNSRNESTNAASVADIGFVLIFSLGLALVTSLPYLVGRLAGFRGCQFSDILVFEQDQNNYLAYAHQAELGHWLFHNPMTAEPSNDVLLNSEWLISGKSAEVFGISVRAATHIVRLCSLLLLCSAIYWFAALSFRNTAWRRVTLVAVMTGGGFGWLPGLHLIRVRPGMWPFLDLSTGLFPFFWSLNIGHFLFPQAFAILGLCLFLRGETTGGRIWYGASVTSWLEAVDRMTCCT